MSLYVFFGSVYSVIQQKYMEKQILTLEIAVFGGAQRQEEEQWP